MWNYLPHQEQTGKSGTALLACKRAGFKHILIVTKKNALDGWYEHIENLDIGDMRVTVLNYHQVGTMKEVRRKRQITLKVDRDDFDAIVIDESHSYISAAPKPSNMFYVIRTVVADKPVLYLSATPHAQGYHLLYHQFKISKWTPWQDYASFYKWWNDYGIEDKKYIGPNQTRETYTKIKEDMVLNDIDGHFSYKTRAEVGIEHEPNDVVHYVELSDYTKNLYNELVAEKVIEVEGIEIVADSVMKERTSLHMLEGGVALSPDKELIDISNITEKIAYIKKVWGDKNNMVIMYNYRAERLKLQKHFANAVLSQATSNAEGVDYSGYEHLIIYSQDFSTARHSQRRARQANVKRETEIKVHYLLCKGAISEQVYKTVSINKENFVDKHYQRSTL